MAIKTFTTGEVLTASDTNTYLANSGLVYITSASATSGTVLTIDNCFTSTYDNYLVLLDGWKNATGGSGISMQLRASGSPSNSAYYYTATYANYAASPTMSMYGASNGASYDIGSLSDNSGWGGGIVEVFGPMLPRPTGFNTRGFDPRTAGSGNRFTSGFHNGGTQAYDGISFSIAYTITNAKVTVYGYRKA